MCGNGQRARGQRRFRQRAHCKCNPRRPESRADAAECTRALSDTEGYNIHSTDIFHAPPNKCTAGAMRTLGRGSRRGSRRIMCQNNFSGFSGRRLFARRERVVARMGVARGFWSTPQRAPTRSRREQHHDGLSKGPSRLRRGSPYGLSRVMESFFVAPPGIVAPWQTFAAARPFRRTWHVAHRPFLQSNLIRRPARWATLPMGSPCFATTFLLPFCGNVTSTEPCHEQQSKIDQ